VGRPKKRKSRSKTYEVDLAQVSKVVDAAKERVLTEEEFKLLKTCENILVDLLVREPRPDERGDKVFEDLQKAAAAVEAENEPDAAKPKSPRKGGNGRTPRDEYRSATDCYLDHPELKPGDPCPCGCGYRLYPSPRDAVFRHFIGQVPIKVTFYYRRQLKSAGCDNVYTAPLPDDVGPSPYHRTAVSMFILMRYGLGLPLYRQAAMFTYLGVPIAASTQYEVVAEHYKDFKPIGDELKRQGAQGEVGYLDDTGMKILNQVRLKDPDRTGTFTTGIISTREAIQIALFFTGENHAGENMKEVLQHRSRDLPALIQMSDALSRNFSELEADEVIECCCLCHGRRNFVEIARAFPQECRRVLEALGHVYATDRRAKDDALDPQQRFALHQKLSQPVMDELKKWMDEQFELKKVEPNSALGSAIKYMKNHWDKLTAFLRVPGAPLDNNVAERALKKVVLHRKNSLFYRTAKGAAVGDLFMSIIYTCQLNGVDPFDYLNQVQKHSAEVKMAPAAWMPWIYKETIAAMAGTPAPVDPAA